MAPTRIVLLATVCLAIMCLGGAVQLLGADSALLEAVRVSVGR